MPVLVFIYPHVDHLNVPCSSSSPQVTQVPLPPWRPLRQYLQIFLVSSVAGVLWTEARDVSSHPAEHRTVPHETTQRNVSSAPAEKTALWNEQWSLSSENRCVSDGIPTADIWDTGVSKGQFGQRLSETLARAHVGFEQRGWMCPDSGQDIHCSCARLWHCSPMQHLGLIASERGFSGLLLFWWKIGWKVDGDGLKELVHGTDCHVNIDRDLPRPGVHLEQLSVEESRGLVSATQSSLMGVLLACCSSPRTLYSTAKLIFT